MIVHMTLNVRYVTEGDNPWLDYTNITKNEIFELVNYVDSLDCQNNIEIKIYSSSI